MHVMTKLWKHVSPWIFAHEKTSDFPELPPPCAQLLCVLDSGNASKACKIMLGGALALSPILTAYNPVAMAPFL
jgi:hypothetical protein